MKKVLVKINFLVGGHGQCMASYFNPVSNKPIRKKFASKEEALKYKFAMESKYMGKNLTNVSDMTIGDAIFIFLSKYPNSYLKKSKKRLDDFCNTFGEFPPNELSKEVLELWFKQIKQENDYADNTMFGAKIQFNALFKFLVREKVIKKNPLEDIETIRTPPIKRKHTHLSSEQIKTLLNSAKRLSPGYLYPILLTFAETAAKTFEVLNLEWNEINFKTNTIYLKKSKNLQTRDIAMSSTLAKILKEKKVFAEYVFTDSNHEQFNKNKLKRAINEFKRKSEVDFEWACSDLRHSYAYNFLEASEDLQKLSYQLGHLRLHETKIRYMNVVNAIPEIEPLY